MLKHILAGLCDLVYPPHCLNCRTHYPSFSPTGVLCPPCENSLRFNSPPFCPKCSRHLAHMAQPRCRQCRTRRIQFDFAWAACLYEDPLKRLIHQFKYQNRPYLSKYFGGLAERFIRLYRLDIAQFDLIVPVPLHPVRLRERGYNQSLLLAHQLSARFGIDVAPKRLIRVKNTGHQTFLAEKERWTNIQGAFRILNSSGIPGKKILIIDDLLTTGATVSQAAGLLREAGARTVGVLTLAVTL